MPKVYMVKSSLILLVCYVNIMFETLGLSFCFLNFTGRNSCPFSGFQGILHVLDVLFNVFVILYADRRLELFLKNSNKYIAMCSKVIEKISCKLSSQKNKLLNLASSARNTFSANLESLAFTIFLLCQNWTTSKAQTSRSEVKIVLNTKEECKENVKTPEICSVYNLRNANRPQSDPPKKIEKLIMERSIRAQSPELFKNKIYKSRMNVTNNLSTPKPSLSNCRRT